MKIKYYLKTKYNQFRFSLCASENFFYLSFYKYLYRPAKGKLSGFLSEYSSNNKPITFLQIGANDGFIYDPLQKFIKRDNWEGVMLEPQPIVFRNFLTKIHAKRPEIIPINAALSSENGKTILYTIAFSSERWATGLSTFDKNVLIEKFKDGTIAKKAKKQGIKVPDNKEEWIKELEIETISSNSLIEMFNGKKINLLAIDTEGFDFEILKMLPLEQMLPDVIIYEEEHFDKSTKDDCKKYLEALGYVYHQVDRDVYATR
jgi:FkbM family methyltransferase